MCSAVNITTGFQALAVIDFFFDLLAAQGMGKIFRLEMRILTLNIAMHWLVTP